VPKRQDLYSESGTRTEDWNSGVRNGDKAFNITAGGSMPSSCSTLILEIWSHDRWRAPFPEPRCKTTTEAKDRTAIGIAAACAATGRGPRSTIGPH
jgi:hypothetical protein